MAEGKLRLKLLAGAALAALVQPGLAQAAIVGTAGAANTRSTGTPPSGSLRVIEIGAQVVANEKIETSASGSVQLLFIDKTTLSIGPNSTVIIDKFVFNPASGQGEMALTLGKGVLRVVGGQATHTGGATVKTPVAAVGLRGGIMTAKHTPGTCASASVVGEERPCGTEAILGYGVLTMTSGGTTQTVTRPGFFVQSVSATQPPSLPARASSALTNQTNAALTSKGGQSGGSAAKPSDQQAAANNIGTPTSVAAPLVITPRAVVTTSATFAATTTQLTQQAQQTVLSTPRSVGKSPPPPPPSPPPTITLPSPPPPPPGQATVPTAYALTTTADSGLGSGVPYLTASFAGTGGFTVSPILGYRPGGLNKDGTPATASNVLQAGIQLSGTGSSQTSRIFVMTSRVLQDPNFGFTQAGGFDATGRLSSGSTSKRAKGSVSSLPNSIKVDADSLPTGSFGTNQNRFDTQPTGHYTGETAFTNAPSATNYTYNQTSTRIASPQGLGADHPTALMSGGFAGLMQTVTIDPAGSSNGKAGAPYIINGGGSVFLNGSSSEMGAQIVVANGLSTSQPQPGQVVAAIFSFGSSRPDDPSNSAGLNRARSAYIDRTHFGARSEAIYNSGANTETSTIIDPNITSTTSLGLRTFSNNPGSDPNLTLSRTGLLMVTAETVGANTSPFLSSISSAKVTPCECEYTQWGFWSADTLRTDAKNNISYSDRGNLMLWQAGIQALATNIPTTGTATYTGHAIANISNNGSQYVAAGTFSNQVNFGTKVGQVQVGGLDGATYGGTVSLGSLAGPPNSAPAQFFTGTLNSGASNHVMTMFGQFYQGGPTNSTPLYGEMGGNIQISGPNNYLGAGIFVGRKP